MADPITIALIAASTAMSVAGAQKQAEAQENSYIAQAQANDYNAQVMRNNAVTASNQSNAKEEAQRRHFRALQGQAYAGVAQSGTGFDGSNSDMLEQNSLNNELDALTIRYEGQNQVKGLIAQSELETYQGKANRVNAQSAKVAGNYAMGSALLSGATQGYMAYNNLGVWKKGG